MRAFLALLLLALAPCLALADFTGRVVKVSDGDTLTVLVNKAQIRVRLLDIDAPERKQAFYKRSGQSLAQMCAGKIAEVISSTNDRYGRPLGPRGQQTPVRLLEAQIRFGTRLSNDPVW